MASSIGAIAAIAAVIGLAGDAIQLSSRQKKFSENIQGILDELELLTQVLKSMEDCETADPGSLPSIEHTIQACRGDIEKLRRKLRDSESSRSFVVRLKWSERVSSRYVLVLKRHRENFTHVLSGVQLSRSRIMEARVGALNSERERDDKTWVATQQTRLLDWLYPEAFDRTHVKIHRRRQRDTCQWILKSPEFIEWKDSSYRSLWGYGIPGAGKTFVSSMVIDYLLSSTADNYGVAYIYFNHDQKGSVDIFSSLVKQLVCQVPQIPEVIEKLYETLKGQQKRPSLEELCTVLIVLTKSFVRTFVVCDALDECHQEARQKEYLPLFHRIREAGVNLFITSREYPEDIHNFLSGSALKIRISAKDEDIALYIVQKIDENSRARRLVDRAQCEDRVISCLTNCAKGMFLFVHLYLEHICQQATSKQILAELDKIESSSGQEKPLDPTYDRAMTLLRLKSRSCVDLASRIFSWLAKAQRTLTVDELRTVIAIEPERYELEEMDLPDRIVILDMCVGLVTIDESDDTIRPVHPTLEEYLSRNSIILKDADFQLTMACATFLSFDIFTEGACNSDYSLRTRRGLYPFLDYAAKNLPFHLEGCDEESTTQLILKFLENPGSVNSYLQAVYTTPKDYIQDSGVFSDEDGYSAYPRGQNSLHIAAALGHCSVARLLVEDTGIDIDAVDNNGRTAIHLASSEGHESVARLLLQKGANPFIVDKDGVTALDWARGKGQESLVRSMLQKRAESPGLPVDAFEDQTSAVQLPLKDNNVSATDNDGNIKAIRANLSSKAGRYNLETTILEDFVIHTVYKTDLAARQRKVPIEERWALKKEIGVGGFGVVLLEEEKGGKLRAVKKLPLARRNVDYSQELNILAKLTDHPYLFVEFLGWYEDSQFLYIAMEYVEYGDLSQYIKDGSARLKAREIANQLYQGLMVLHGRQICHRDLKPQNVLIACVKPIWVKIADFGVSKREKNTNLHTQLGTGGYLAPEILGLLPKRFGTGRSYTNAVDFWALGCLVHEILTSKLPFAEEPFPIGCSEMSLFEEFGEESIAPQVDMGLLLDYCQGTIEFPTGPLQGSQVSGEGIRFVKRLLDPDPSSRIPPAEGLKSPWLLEEEN